MQCPHRDELIDPFDGASDRCDNFVAIYVSAMSPRSPQKINGATRDSLTS